MRVSNALAGLAAANERVLHQPNRHFPSADIHTHVARRTRGDSGKRHGLVKGRRKTARQYFTLAIGGQHFLSMAQHAFVTGERALGIWQPLSWPKYATIPVGMFMTALQYVTSMHRELVSAPGKVNSKDETASSKDALPTA